MKDHSFMSRYGDKLVANGYAILPLQPGAKKPGRYIRGKWIDYADWTRHAARGTTEYEVALWEQWPDAGVGVVGGNVAAIDIDIKEDPELAQRVEDLARELLGDTPAVRIGKAPKRMLIYRTAAPFKGLKRHPLEILCLGQQFVAYARHPETGRPYEWPEESLADLDIEKLPAIDEEAARAFLDEAVALLPESLRPTRLAVGASAGESHPAHAQAGTLPAIRAALAYLPNAELDYDSWVRIGLALKGALGEAGDALFADWSAQAAKNDEGFTAKTWAGFKPNSIGAGTIYHLAMERGWRPDNDMILDGGAPVDERHPAEGLLAKLAGDESECPAQPEATPSFDLVIPGGVVGQLTDYMVRTARRPQPLLSLGASLCAIGALMGRKYRTESNLRSNLYVVGVADSGSGKNHSREIINELFVQAGLANYLGGNKIASGAGLLTAVHRQPAILFQIDEFGMFLSAAADRRRSPRHITDILDNMTELYTSAGGIFLGAEYANRDGLNERRDINQPCLCVYGTTTPLHFWNALQGSNVVDGSLARFIILPTAEDYPEENLSAGVRRAPPSLIASLKQITEGGGHSRGNLAGVLSGPETAVDPMVVPMLAEARDAFHALSAENTHELRKARGTAFTSILARIGENAQKLALIIAVGRDPVQPEITAEDAAWAIVFVRHFAGRTMDQVERHVADNDTDRSHKRVRDIIRSAGAQGLTKTDLIRRTQWLDLRKRNEVIATLVEGGLIKTEMRPSATRSAMVFKCTDIGAQS